MPHRPNGWTIAARRPISSRMGLTPTVRSVPLRLHPERNSSRMAGKPMGSRVRDLAEFLRQDGFIRCGAIDGAEGTDDPYTAAAKRILVRVHQSELPVADQGREPSPPAQSAARRSSRGMRPVDGVTLDEAAQIRGSERVRKR